MSFGGFGVAYDAVRAALAAQNKIDEARGTVRRSHGRRYGNQMVGYIAERKEQIALLDSIEAQLTDPSPRKSERKCPECQKPFIVIDAKDIDIEACQTCGSYWFDPGELGSLTHRPADILSREEPVTGSRFSCPVCGEKMKEHIFKDHYDLLVDRCPNNHGVYLERDELERAIDLTTALKLKRDKDRPTPDIK